MREYAYNIDRRIYHDDGACEHWPTQCLELDGIVYLPSYDSKSLFALPGGGFHPAYYLLGQGAVWVERMLWKRTI